jgi:hypothetical protein
MALPLPGQPVQSRTHPAQPLLTLAKPCIALLTWAGFMALFMAPIVLVADPTTLATAAVPAAACSRTNTTCRSWQRSELEDMPVRHANSPHTTAHLSQQHCVSWMKAGCAQTTRSTCLPSFVFPLHAAALCLHASL